MPAELYHEGSCNECGAPFGHLQSCSLYKEMEGITPELEAQAETDKDLREKQLQEIDETLARQANEPLPAEYQHPDVEAELHDIKAKIKECGDMCAGLDQIIGKEKKAELWDFASEITWCNRIYLALETSQIQDRQSAADTLQSVVEDLFKKLTVFKDSVSK